MAVKSSHSLICLDNKMDFCAFHSLYSKHLGNGFLLLWSRESGITNLAILEFFSLRLCTIYAPSRLQFGIISSSVTSRAADSMASPDATSDLPLWHSATCL